MSLDEVGGTDGSVAGKAFLVLLLFQELLLLSVESLFSYECRLSISFYSRLPFLGKVCFFGCETLSLNVSGFMLNSKSDRHLVLQESLKVLGIGAVIWYQSSHDVMVGR